MTKYFTPPGMARSLLAFSLLLSSPLFGQTITNPVLDQDFPDPTVIRAAGKYYAYATNSVVDGKVIHIQVASSSDLQHWKREGDALPQKPVWAEKDFWAPHVLYDSAMKKYVLFFSAESKDDHTGKCIGVAFSDVPQGPFTDKGTPLICGTGFRDIDPFAFIDPETGKRLLYWGSDFQPIRVQELTRDWSSLKPGTSPEPLVFPGKEKSYDRLIEGAWVDHYNGKYYLYYSGDNCCGARAHYAVMVARSDHATGPFTTMGEANKTGSSVVLEQNARWLAPGHNSIFRDGQGRAYIAYHALSRDTMKRHGRVFCISKIQYLNGWPVVANGRSGYHFDTTISRPVLEHYLSRAITMQDLLVGHGDFEDNLRMITHTGAKFLGRSVCQWGHEADLLKNLQSEKQLALKVHKADPDIILEACIFEIVTTQVDQVPVPAWAFRALGMPAEQRHFRYADMLFPDGRYRNQWGKGASVPDISRPETMLWFYFLAVSYMNAGIEALHFGQIELMNKNDPQLENCRRILSLVRAYATQHARRHMVLCNAHVPGGGLVYEGKLLFDFHEFPLRIKEVPDSAEKAVLEKGFTDAFYGRSKGGMTYSGWACKHLPYLVEFDNYGVSDHPGKAHAKGAAFDWIWGYDEITWFAEQPESYRAYWLHYAWDWIRKTDPDGFLEMPGSRVLTSPLDHRKWYYANRRSAAVPEGYDDEETIRAIWAADPAGITSRPVGTH